MPWQGVGFLVVSGLLVAVSWRSLGRPSAHGCPRFFSWEAIAALFEDGQVACVTNPVSGTGHRSLGALLDNLHLAASVGLGQVAAKVFAKRNLVVGKSMALRRPVLQALGGFHAFPDFLAEDYAIGCAISPSLGRVAVARLPVLNVAVERSVNSFWGRYARWSVIHRTAVTPLTYLAQALLNPWPLSLLAVAEIKIKDQGRITGLFEPTPRARRAMRGESG